MLLNLYILKNMNKKYNFYAEGGSLDNHGLKEGDQIIKTMSGGVQKVKTKTGDIVYVDLANGYRGDMPPLPFAKGGKLTNNYVKREDLNTITIKKGNQKLTYKVSDVYNGAYKLQDGARLEELGFYVSKRNVIKVQLRDGKDIKVANGYWIKKGAKPIYTSKYDDGGFMADVYANGGVIGKEMTFYRHGEEEKGIVGEVNEDGSYNVATKYSIILVEPQDVISINDAPKKKGWLFEEGGDTKMVDGVMYEKVKFSNGVEDYYYSSDLHKVNSYCSENGLNSKNQKDFEKAYSELRKQNKIAYKDGGASKLSFDDWMKKNNIEVYKRTYYWVADDGKGDYLYSGTKAEVMKSLREDYKKSYEGGGKTTFKQKATAIAKNFEGKKVEPKYQKEYGKTYDKAEAKEVGNKIAGSQKAKYDSKMSAGGKTKRGGAMQLAKQIRKEGESWQSALKRANEQVRNK